MRYAPLASIGFPDREEFSRVENVRNLRLTAFLKHADRHRDQYLFSARPVGWFVMPALRAR